MARSAATVAGQFRSEATPQAQSKETSKRPAPATRKNQFSMAETGRSSPSFFRAQTRPATIRIGQTVPIRCPGTSRKECIPNARTAAAPAERVIQPSLFLPGL
ncbi:MAG: hypothetical protein EBZ53_01400, partial [Verrucomicrobia bacterium]|nr:hypothetical protein [Verrucomicrobiota bacterium]